jgi:hypothetical protein
MKDEADIKEQILAEQRRKNREAMPEVAKLMDEINAKYPGSRLIWAKDLATGKEIGKKSEPKSFFVIPPDFKPAKEVINVRKGRGKTR